MRKKKDTVQAYIRELGNMHSKYQVPHPPPPPLNELLNTTIDEHLDWDPVVNIRKTPTQTDASYEEQMFVIKVCVGSINSYLI